MKKKLLAILLVVAMVVALTVPVMAAGVSATASVKGNDVTITVTYGGTKTTEEFKNGFVKNGAVTFELDGGYKVKVEFNGNGVKNVTVVVTPANSPVPGEDSALPNNGDNSGQPNLFGGITLDQYNNADFHCNADGNGRVWTTLGKSVTQKLSVPLHFVANTGQPVSNQANAATAWHLVHDNTYICEECGSAEWVTFSNNSGLPDGKNIQMNHPGQYIEIVKVWIDAEGHVIQDTKNLSAKFIISWTGADGKERTREVGPGKYFFANDLIDSIKVVEKDIKNYTLILINGEPFEILAPVELDENLSVSFTNKEDPYAIILKEWDMDGIIIKGGSIVVGDVTITALFDIYAYDEDEDGNPVRGELLKAGLLAGEKFYTDPGKYIVAEQPKDGFIAQDDKVIEVGENQVGTCTFTNVPEHGGERASLSFEKKVEDKNIVTWLVDKFPSKELACEEYLNEDWDNICGNCIACILYGLEFYLTDTTGTVYGPSKPDLFTGRVLFEELDPGEYTLSELVTGAAVGKFMQMDDIDLIIAEGDGNFLVLGGTVKGVIEGAEIAEGDLFTIVNGYGMFGYNRNTDGLNYKGSGLTGDGDLFYIGVINTTTNYEFASFCANAGSATFAEGQGQYMVAHSMNDLSYLQAFNYIVDNYGGKENLTLKGAPTSTRRIAQTVVWALLGAIDINSEAWDDVYLTDAEKAAVENTLANYGGYVGSGSVVDVVYMMCAEHGVDDYGLANCQPQIVPIFGTFYVENEPGGVERGSVQFNKVKNGGNDPIEFWLDENDELDYERFYFELYRFVEGIGYTELVDTYSSDYNGLVAVEDLAPGSYVFKEVTYVDSKGVEWKAIYPNDGDGLYFTITEDGDTVWPEEYELEDQEVPTVNNVPLYGALDVSASGTLTKYDKVFRPFWQKEYTPTQIITKYTYSGSSITAGTQDDIDANRIIQNGHFVYAKLNTDDFLFDDVELTLYCGQKFDEVGSVKISLLDGYLSFEFSETKSMGDYGVLVSEEGDFNHSDIKHDNPTSVVCPVEDGVFYLYLHIDNGVFVTETVPGPVENLVTADYFVKDKFVKRVYGETKDLDIVIVVTDSDGAVVTDLGTLLPGVYTVTYSIDGEEVFSEEVTVTAGGTETSSYDAGSINEFSGTNIYRNKKYLPDIWNDLDVIINYV